MGTKPRGKRISITVPPDVWTVLERYERATGHAPSLMIRLLLSDMMPALEAIAPGIIAAAEGRHTESVASLAQLLAAMNSEASTLIADVAAQAVSASHEADRPTVQESPQTEA